MTFNPSVPNASQSPGQFPPQNSANFTQLKKIINADHVFNDTAQDNDGIHKQVTLVAKSVGFVPVLVTGANGMLYSMIDSLGRNQLNYFNGSTNFLITPSIAIRAAVNFDEAGGIRSQFNVSSVTKNGDGDYTITFDKRMPDTNYIVQITGQRKEIEKAITGCVKAGPYPGSTTDKILYINFFGESNNLRSITTGFVAVMSVT